ncbi:MAG: hypothetical protein ACYC5Y_14950 [Symbiobacteriia bacterium]
MAQEAPRNAQLLAANSFLFGTTNLLVLDLPTGWVLRSGYQQPEVDARHLVGKVSWATLANAHYYLQAPEAAGSIEFWVRIFLKPRPVGGDPITIAGHQGTCKTWQDDKGFEHQLVRWSCPRSGRALELEAQGRGLAQGQMAALAEALQRCQCHTD